MATLVRNITTNDKVRELLKKVNLNALFISWDDAGRYKGSCVGDNISDMTLRCEKDEGKSGSNMPMIRNPNFSDVTGDIPLDAINISVGNATGNTKHVVPLRDYLKHFGKYEGVEEDEEVDLLLERDNVVLANAQCCVLPCEDGGTTEFCVNLYNYQTTISNPAVLVLVVTKDGTSAQVLNSNTTKLYFNDNGTARAFQIERMKDVRERRTGKPQKAVRSHKEMDSEESAENSILVFQIPLKVPPPQYGGYSTGSSYDNILLYDTLCYGGGGASGEAYGCEDYKEEESEEESAGGAGGLFDDDDDNWSTGTGYCVEKSVPTVIEQVSAPMPATATAPSVPKKRGKGADMGVISLGSERGEYTGTKGFKLERDPELPIRLTYQCYRVTDEDTLDDDIVHDIRDHIDYVMSNAISEGSLVTDTSDRATESTKEKKKVEVVETAENNETK